MSYVIFGPYGILILFLRLLLLLLILLILIIVLLYPIPYHSVLFQFYSNCTLFYDTSSRRSSETSNDSFE